MNDLPMNYISLSDMRKKCFINPSPKKIIIEEKPSEISIEFIDDDTLDLCKEKQKKVNITRVQCIKIVELRKKGYDNLEEWMKDKNNIYVGRQGRIFITNKDGSKRIFHYNRSKWANPYSLKDYDIDKSLLLYKNYLKEKNLINDILELKGKTLGCFCKTEKCHAQILKEFLRNTCEAS